MKNIYIIVSKFYNRVSRKITIGGVQTYMQDLARLISNYNSNAFIIQIEDVNSPEAINVNDLNIILYPQSKTLFSSRNQSTFDKIYETYNGEQALFIISTDQMDIVSKANNVIQIQHGVAFDIPGYMIGGIIGRFKIFQFINKLMRCLKNIKRFYNTKKTVCVDYNFFNWFRTLGTIYKKNIVRVIPNYSSAFISENDLMKKVNYQNEKFNIIFARRFVEHRGVILFADAIEEILKRYNNVFVTFAGEGPYFSYITEKFKNNQRVTIAKFSASESVNFHKGFDVAVIPTIFSEGTSLSACEAMAAGCIPVATYVGGLSNIILNEFNGFLIYPNTNDLISILDRIISMNVEQRKMIALNAYNSAKYAFSIDRWSKQWRSFLDL